MQKKDTPPIFWRSYFEEERVKTRQAVIGISLIGAFVYLLPAIPNFIRYYGTSIEYVFWGLFAVRVGVVIGFLSLGFVAWKAKNLSYRQFMRLRSLLLVVWVVFWIGIFCVGTTMPQIPERSGPINQLFFGMFGGLFMMSVLFRLRMKEAIFQGVFVTVAFFSAHAIAGTLDPVNLVSYTIFLAGVTLFVSYGTRNNERLRRNDFALRNSLAKSNAKLKELDRMKTQFFSNVSHEFRTPLTLIIGPTESILSGSAQPTRLFLESVKSNAYRLLRQVNLMLDFARLEDGKATLDLSQESLPDLIDQLVLAALPQAERLSIKLSTENLASLGVARIDQNKMETIAANLLGNAIKFSPVGGSVVVRGGQTDGFQYFEIEDNGPGIPQGQLQFVFDRFFQVDDPSLRKAQGSGLGLSMAREFARLHGGDITVTSSVGKGSCFRVLLPKSLFVENIEDDSKGTGIDGGPVLALGDLTESDDLSLKSVEEHNRKESGLVGDDRLKILVVEDNTEMRDYILALLRPHYRIFLAMNGEHGLEVALRVRPDLILSDLTMPKMLGTQLCEEIRRRSEFRGVPFLLMSAKNSAEVRIEGLEIGADGFLTKPVPEAELLARLRNLLSNRLWS